MVPHIPPQAVSGKQLRASEYRLDLWLVGATLLLAGFGLVMVASASITTADRGIGAPLHYFVRQFGYVIFGLCVAWVITHFPLGKKK